MRYLPAELGLRHLLSQARFESANAQEAWRTRLDELHGYDTEYKFWPRHTEGEIDLLLESPQTLVGVEVKYFSYLSSEDEDLQAEFDPATSQNQLVRYAQMMQRVGGAKSKYLVFLAPLATVTQVEAAMKRRGSISSDVSLGYLSVYFAGSKTADNDSMLNYQNRTYASARFVAENMLGDLKYDDKSKTVGIRHLDPTKPILRDLAITPNVHVGNIAVNGGKETGAMSFVEDKMDRNDTFVFKIMFFDGFSNQQLGES